MYILKTMKPNTHLCPSRLASITSSLKTQHTLQIPNFVLKTNQQTLNRHDTNSQRQQQQQHRDNIISLIKSHTQKHHLLQLQAHTLRTHLLHDPAVSLPLLCRFAYLPNDILYARKIFNQIKNPTLFIYNAMLKGYCLSDFPEEGLCLFRDMRMPADAVSYLFAVKACVKSLCFSGGVQLHGRVLREGYRSDCVLMTSLMEFYSGFETAVDVQKVFDEMSERDVVAWNVLISCYVRNKRSRDALVVFEGMESGELGCEPDDVTCLLVVQACASLGALEFGERVHGYIEEHGYGGGLNLCNALIGMYSRCGCLDKAYEVFKGMRVKNMVSWSAMIHGLAMNGHGRDALEAFEEMQKMNVIPDDQTFTGVLAACSQCGLVDEGMMIFDRMSKEFGIVPNIHHYGCMVDLLCRVGKLDQAYQFIVSMEVKPDATTWRTLLGACKVHGHVTLGERVIEHLIELRAEEAGDYVLLLNMYSSTKDWEKVDKVKNLMKEKAIQAMPGCSTIELKGRVHEFVEDDVSHFRKDEIYSTLIEINHQLKIAGYVADISPELQNLGTEEKRYISSYHSVKLAIAFGVLETPPGTRIRIAKNERICNDCHNFAKLFSSVYDRYVIIRDSSQFHHFRGGRCSCNDYW